MRYAPNATLQYRRAQAIVPLRHLPVVLIIQKSKCHAVQRAIWVKGCFVNESSIRRVPRTTGRFGALGERHVAPYDSALLQHRAERVWAPSKQPARYAQLPDSM